ncbi:MAG: tetraacyldisaccharide 4'-kinase [Hyphomonadaceae bacterium]
MRPPEFWKADAQGRDRAPVLQALLAPAAFLYEAAGAHRQRSAKPRRVAAPVICVGNLTLGGAGKTPVTRALRARLGPGAHVLLRGYGGTAKGVTRVRPDARASEVGDEALLHAADGPTWTSIDRVAGAEAAIAAGARLILMDDGFQNPGLAKDFSIVVIDAAAQFGNGRVFPAGPLRESAARGLARADAVLLMGAPPPKEEWPQALQTFKRPILHAALEPTAPPPPEPLAAFAGIARPEKFFDALSAAGADLVETAPYRDHHPYSQGELTWLAKLADERGARLITTEKDAARLSPEWRARVATYPIVARFRDEAALDALLAPIAARLGADA